MIPEEDINALLRSTIDGVLGIPGFAVRAQQLGAPRPSVPFASVQFMTEVNIGWEQEVSVSRSEDPDVDVTIEGHRSPLYSISFFKDGSMDNARAVRTAFSRQATTFAWGEAGVSLTRRSAVRNVAFAFENGWEDRAQFDVILNVVGSDVETRTTIQSATIQIDFQASGSSNNIIIEVP